MTRFPDSHGFDPRIADWLEADPDQAPRAVLDTVLAAVPSVQQRRAPRAPWRWPFMTRSALPGAAIALVALVTVGGLALTARGPAAGTHPNESPATTPAAPAAAAAAPTTPAAVNLGRTFYSPLYGYSIRRDWSWTAYPASVVAADPETTVRDAYDLIQVDGTDTTIEVLAWPLDGQPFQDWLTAHHAMVTQSLVQGCNGGDSSTWLPVAVGGQPGVWIPMCDTAAAVVPVGDRAFAFASANASANRAHLSEQLFRDTLASVDFHPFSSTFTSPTYGYTIAVGHDWTASPARGMWTGPDNSPPFTDEIAVTGTDTTISAASQQLAAGQTYAEFLAAFQAIGAGGAPSGCDGGDPSSWPAVTVGGHQGGWEQMCNAAEVLVNVGQRVYVFTWGNSTFFGRDHLLVDNFRNLLETVTFAPAP